MEMSRLASLNSPQRHPSSKRGAVGGSSGASAGSSSLAASSRAPGAPTPSSDPSSLNSTLLSASSLDPGSTRMTRSSSTSSTGNTALLDGLTSEGEPLMGDSACSGERRSSFCSRLFRSPPMHERTVLYNAKSDGSSGYFFGTTRPHSPTGWTPVPDSSSGLGGAQTLTGPGAGLGGPSGGGQGRITVEPDVSYPRNVVRNQKYSVISFIPLFLINEFRFFFNLYFLVVALSQLFPVLQVGFLFTYVAPLVMVLFVSMCKEIYDDFQRFIRDRAANSERFTRVSPLTGLPEPVAAKDISIGDIVVLHANQRVPADCILLRTHTKGGSVFIRTDQLDGETDWKLRRSVPSTQALGGDEALVQMRAKLVAEAPRQEIYGFMGTFTFFGMAPGYRPPRTAAALTAPGSTTSAAAATAGGAAGGAGAGGRRGKKVMAAAPLDFDSSQDDDLPAATSTAGTAGAGDEEVSEEHEDDLASLRLHVRADGTNTAPVGSSGNRITGPSAVAATIPRSTPTARDSNNDNDGGEDIEAGGGGGAPAAGTTEPLSLENTLWANTVIASGTVAAAVVYTGKETRSSLNASQPVTKTGLLDDEVNQLSKVLFIMTLILALAMTTLRGFEGQWYIYMFRFILLFSSIIPISLRVNLDMGKALYSLIIMRDKDIDGTVVRSSTIPEELGRVSYVFSDKTGTLTQNVMSYKVLQLAPPLSYGRDNLPVLRRLLRLAFAPPGTTAAAVEEAEAAAALTESLSNSSAANTNARAAGKTDHDGATGGYRRKSYHHHDDDDDVDDDDDGGIDVGDITADPGDDGYDHDDDDDGYAPFGSGGRVRPARPSSPITTNFPGYPTSSSSSSAVATGAGAGAGAAGSSLSALSSMRSPSSSTASRSAARTNGSNTAAARAATDAARAATAATADFIESMELGGMLAGDAIVRTRDALLAIALCHNVTPTVDDDGQRVFQAASPDEVALVSFADSVGLRLEQRDTHSVTLRLPGGASERYDVLADFPFTSESKRMGIVVRSQRTGATTFFLKGAESALIPRVAASDWLEEEVAGLARVGLRTLVFAKRDMAPAEVSDFLSRLAAAKTAMANREQLTLQVLETIERDLTLIGLTGVEDKLQDNVRSSLEMLRNAGVKVWMLTGDKAETAACIGISARLVDRGQSVVRMLGATTRSEALRQLGQTMSQHNACIIVDGVSLQMFLDHFPWDFLEAAAQAPTVICCRCSPTQKAEVVTRMKKYTGKRTLAIGDGGNDVSMIQAADVGVGIVGKEGKQAAMAADFSILQFSYLVRLMLWHGRNSYKRSASLSQFVMHRGLIISIIQAVFSSLFFYVAVSIYTGWLMVGYTTVFTMLPVFSLVLDEDVDPATAFMFPELYRDLQKGRPLSYKTFFIWCFLSVYQGGLIMILGIVLFEDSFVNIVSITFTALILAELANVALSIHKWNKYMVFAQILSILAYLIAMVVLRSYFDITFIFTVLFMWKVLTITAVVTLPPALLKWAIDKYDPPAHTKVSGAGSR